MQTAVQTTARKAVLSEITTPSQEIAAKLLKAYATFTDGCSNTQIEGLSPEACPECSEAFVDAVRRIVATRN